MDEMSGIIGRVTVVVVYQALYRAEEIILPHRDMIFIS